MSQAENTDIEDSDFRKAIYVLSEMMSTEGPVFMAGALAEAACYIAEFVPKEESDKLLSDYWWAVWNLVDGVTDDLNTMDTPYEKKA